MSAHKHNGTDGPNDPFHMNAPATRKSRTAALVVAAALVAALGGAGVFALVGGHGNVQGDTASAPKVVQMQQSGEDAAKQTQEAMQKKEAVEKAAHEASKRAAKETAARLSTEKAASEAKNMANQERIARVKAEQEKRAAEKKAAEERAEQERIAQEKEAEEKAEQERVVEEKAEQEQKEAQEQTDEFPAPEYTAEQCRDHALKVFDKEGQTTNVTVSDIKVGGGANYCIVEFDLDGQHYDVQMCADDCRVVSGSSTDTVYETVYDENGTLCSTREL